MPRERFRSRLIASPWLPVWGLGLLCLILTMSIVQTVWRDRGLRHEMKKLESEVSTALSEQERLTSLIVYLKSPGYIESEARRTFGFAKPGEEVVVFQNSASNKKGEPGGGSNARKWFRYFFEQAQDPGA